MIMIGVTLFFASAAAQVIRCKRKSQSPTLTVEPTSSKISGAYLNLIGNTPLTLLPKLSALTGCRIYTKMESLNPGGTGKDRAVKAMLLDAFKNGFVSETQRLVFEGTSGSTGISLAALCRAMDLEIHIYMPDDQASEKRALLTALGAHVTVVPTCAISNEDHYVNQARKAALATGGFFVNQFENQSNYQAHFETTGPEIHQQLEQLGESLDAFIMSAGTGGTIAGSCR